MKKCNICQFGSWVVGVSAMVLAICGWMGCTLPNGILYKLLYGFIALVALSFLYYQIVPCPRCVLANTKK